MSAIRATLHHGDVHQVTTTPILGAAPTESDVVRALASTAYGTSLDWRSPTAREIVADLLAARPTGHGWTHLALT